jgi:outer membrane cobalamin receptor
MKTFRSLRLLSVVLLFTPLLVFGQDTNPKSAATARTVSRGSAIEGRVLDPDGKGVANARVTLLAGLTPVNERETNAEGHFRFDKLSGGTYVLTTNSAGFSALSTGVEIHEAESRTIDLVLKISAAEERVVVSASLGGALAPQVGSSVSLVTKQDIEDRDAESVYQVLQGLPSTEVAQTGRRGALATVFIRGGNSNYNQVLIDGIEVNQFGGDFDFSSIATNGVDRIEVLRGPESALYGSNAVAGVINIVSERGEGPPHFSFLAEGGSLYTRRFATGGSGLTGGFSWAYNLSRLDTDGSVLNDDYRNQTSYLSLGYSRSPKREFAFHFFGDASKAGSPGPYGSDPDNFFPGIDTVSRYNHNLFAYQGAYTEQFSSKLRQVFSVSVTPTHDYFVSPSGDSFQQSLRVTIHTHGEATVSPKDVFVYGFEFNREQIKDTFITNASNNPFVLPRSGYGYFAENRWNPTRRWWLTTGLRIDNFRTDAVPPDAFGSRPAFPEASVVKVSPRISTAYLLRDPSNAEAIGATRLHSSFGTGIREPNGFELAFTNNPKLKPEQSISGDIGVEQRFFSDRATFDVTYFYNRYTDQIVVLGGSLTNLSTFSSDNLANSRAQGVESTLRLRPYRTLEVSMQYSWLDSQILALDHSSTVNAPFEVGQPLLRRPRESGSFNVTWRRHALTLNTNAYIRGRVFDVEPNLGTFACTLGAQCFFNAKGYTLANAGFSYQLPRGVEVHGQLNNFLNQKYESVFGFPALHLNFLAGLRYQIPSRR